MTADQLANAIEGSVVAQQVTDDMCNEAFTGKVLLAEANSQLAQCHVVLRNRAAKSLQQNNAAADKAGLTGEDRSRWIGKQARFKPEQYVSLKGGDQPSVAIVTRKAKKGEAPAKGNSAAATKGKGKGGKEQALKAFANLREALDALADAYTLDAIKSEVAKMVKDKAGK